ncbi:MAG TPA: sugar ABC transporter ATP-binding protein [Solirubrobacteraceae bacterium]|nr:sugar ABC transporter ATP-binding protein [Solirubrobacteraceae bacterium]
MSFSRLREQSKRDVPVPANATPRLHASGIGKTFSATRALIDSELKVVPGELHGLVGQNGSGKSTLMKILSGYHAPDPGGRLEMDGSEIRLPLRVTDIGRHGIAVVHQSLGLIPQFSVLENIRIGRLGAGRFTRRIRWSREREQARAVFERLGQSVNLDQPVRELSAEARATVGIARALQDYEPGRGVLLLDEATRALTRRSLRHFYELLGGVTAEGASVVLVSHRLEEVLEVCDRITVLRDGQVAAGGVPASELDEPSLVRLMLGYTQPAHVRRTRAPTSGGDCVAEVEGLRGAAVEEFNVAIKRGEIVGVTGLAGGGFEDIPYLIGGATPAQSGTIKIGARSIDLSDRRRSSIEHLMSAGIVLVPEKREEEGLVLELSVLDNMTLPRMGEHGSPWYTGRGWQQAEVEEMIRRLGIKPERPGALVSTLSGGNQQKVLLGKWLAGSPQFVLLHEPTQAVDVAARRDIIEALRHESDRGCGILISATDVGDLALICDRVLIVRDGRVTQELTGELDQDQIVEATFQAAPAGAAHT